MDQSGFSRNASKLNISNLSRISAPLDFAKEITYTDTNVVAGSLSGIVEVEPGQHTSQNGIDPYYKLFFGTYNQTKNTISPNLSKTFRRLEPIFSICCFSLSNQSPEDDRYSTFESLFCSEGRYHHALPIANVTLSMI